MIETSQRLRPILAGPMPSLDGLRGLAILLVLCHQLDVVRGPGSPVDHALDLALNLGWIGVQLFFVLSGFLITGILLDTKDSPRFFRSFFARRALRIFPLYFLTLFLVFVVVSRVTSLSVDGEHQVFLWTYLVNWTAPFGLGVATLPHFWSLAVEEQFYLIWPFVVRGVSRAGVARLSAALFVAAMGARYAVRALGLPADAAYMWTICRMDALALGALLAASLRSPRAARFILDRRNALFGAAAAIALAGFVVTRGQSRLGGLGQILGYGTLSIGFAALVLAAVLGEARGAGALRKILSWSPLRAIGRVSYGMYVFHVLIQAWIALPLLARRVPVSAPIGAATALAYLAATIALTYVAAWLSYRRVERRFLALKRHFTA